MHAIAILTAIVVPIFLAFFFLAMMSGKQWKAAEERGRARRLADAKMNARLLRLNI